MYVNSLKYLYMKYLIWERKDRLYATNSPSQQNTAVCQWDTYSFIRSIYHNQIIISCLLISHNIMFRKLFNCERKGNFKWLTKLNVTRLYVYVYVYVWVYVYVYVYVCVCVCVCVYFIYCGNILIMQVKAYFD